VRPFGIVYAPSSGENPRPARAKLLPIAAVIAIDPSLSGLIACVQEDDREVFPLAPSAPQRMVGGRPPRVSNLAVAAIQNPEFGQAGRLTYIIIHQVVPS
jgi:hypothetical protein